MKTIARASIILLVQIMAVSALAQTTSGSPASTVGIVTVLGAIGGIAALLTFFFAIRRDRQMKFAQTLFVRLDEIQKSVSAFIAANEGAHTREVLIKGLAEHIPDSDEGKTFVWKQREAYLEQLQDANAVCASEAARIGMLIATSTSKAQLNHELSDKLLKAVYEEVPDSGTISAYGAEYVRQETKWILQNKGVE